MKNILKLVTFFHNLQCSENICFYALMILEYHGLSSRFISPELAKI